MHSGGSDIYTKPISHFYRNVYTILELFVILNRYVYPSPFSFSSRKIHKKWNRTFLLSYDTKPPQGVLLHVLWGIRINIFSKLNQWIAFPCHSHTMVKIMKNKIRLYNYIGMYFSPGWMSQNHLPHSLKHGYWHKNTWFGPFLGFGHWGTSYRLFNFGLGQL